MTSTLATHIRPDAPPAHSKADAVSTHGIVPSLPGYSSDTLRVCFDHCATVTRQRARNFYHGLKLTPEPRRGAIYAIYAWMRAADDVADEPGDLATKRSHLATFARRTETVLRTGSAGETSPSHRSRTGSNNGSSLADEHANLWPALAAAVSSYHLDHAIFHDMIAGLEDDLKTFEYLDERQLSRYCYRVAATAGLACLWIWGLKPGVDRAVAEKLAIDRGQAFQRTNILRDFREDFDASPRRTYLPREAFDQARLTPTQLREWSVPDTCTAFIASQSAKARGFYDASAPLDELIDPACRPTLWAMTRIYSEILTQIEQNPACVVSDRRIRLSGIRKASIALRATAAARFPSIDRTAVSTGV